MSGTEAKSICPILSWTIITIDKIDTIYEGARDRKCLPPEFSKVYQGLPLIRAALHKIEAKAPLKGEKWYDGASSQDAIARAKDCQQSCLRLEAMVRRVLPEAGVPRLKLPPISRMDRYRIALNEYGDDYEVASLFINMSENTQELAKNFLEEAEADLQQLADIQRTLRAMRSSILADQQNSQDALSNLGSGTLNANTSSGYQYNNADQGKQFNATTQFFGPVDPRNQDPREILQQEKEACLSSLKYENLNTRRDRLEEEKAHLGTCNWLFESDQFQEWHRRSELGAHNGVLWIKGHPGTGKSTLMMHNVTYCERKFKDHVVCAHFFSARGDSDEKSPLGLWRSLAYQLVEKEPLLYDRLVPIFRKKSNKTWTENELRKFLRCEMASPQPRPFLFLIDALDECDDYSAGQVVGFLAELSALAVQSNVTLRICLSSRHYPEISIEKRIDLFVDQMKEHHEDIEKYVRDKARSYLPSIQDEIIKKAGGVFLWVILIIAMLKKKNDGGRMEEIQDVVDRAPSGLDELFEDILDKEESNKAETILMFQLVLFAKRLLTPEELYFATIAGTQPERLGSWDRSIVTEKTIRLRIRDSSRGLIEVLEGATRNTVQFIHLSVNDFLTRKNRLRGIAIASRKETNSPSSRGLGRKVFVLASASWWSGLTSFFKPTRPQPDVVSSSNNSITKCCMEYLSKTAQPFLVGSDELKGLAEEHPFLNYSSTYILHHAEDAEPEGPDQEALVDWLLDDTTTFEAFRSIHNGFEDEPGLHCYTGASLIHMLAFHGHRNMLELLLKKKVDVDARFGLMNSALQIASETGDTAMVSILLKHGANPNLQGGIYGNALQVASKEGHREVINLLLDNGARINARGGVYGTALQAAAAGKNLSKTVRLLLERGADVDARGIWGTALQAAVSTNNVEVATILLDCGADLHARGGLFGTVLQAAAGHGRTDLVKALIEKRVDVNARGGVWGSALQAALLASTETAELLLDKGADVSVQGGIYGSILQTAIAGFNDSIEPDEASAIVLNHENFDDIEGDYRQETMDFLNAARKGSVRTVAQMIRYGWDINVQGGLLGSALQAASWSSKGRMVRRLLRLGVDVNLQGGTYGTALQAASAKGHLSIVKMLVKGGADVHTQGGLFGNALQAAAFAGSMLTVKYLLEIGADVNAEGGHFGTALQAASYGEHSRTVLLLLEKGADVQRQGGFLGTALQAASLTGRRSIVEILLERGADVNAQGGILNTALQAASGGPDGVAITQMLLDHGAEVNLQGGPMGTALNAAEAFKEREIMDLLIQHGADLKAYDIPVCHRSFRWKAALWWSQRKVWKPTSGIIMSVCVLSFAGWRLWKKFSVSN